MEIAIVLIYLLIFPGLLFQSAFSTYLEWVDRKLYARMQNRRGPMYTGNAGVLQPVADIVKLFAKEDLVPAAANKFMFGLMPLVALASVCTAGLLVPFWVMDGFTSFEGDIIVMAYLLAIPTFALFLGGWYSSSPFSLVGATRVLTQLFAYEVPFFLALLTPAMISGSWQLSKIADYHWTEGGALHAGIGFVAQVFAFLVALISLQAKLERVPFDIPEAETEVVAGPLTEYSGKKYGMFRLQKDILMLVGSALLATLFLPSFSLHPVAAAIWLLVKTTFVVALLSVIKAGFARIRIDQIVDFSWKYLAPMSLAQFLIVLLLKAKGAL